MLDLWFVLSFELEFVVVNHGYTPSVFKYTTFSLSSLPYISKQGRVYFRHALSICLRLLSFISVSSGKPKTSVPYGWSENSKRWAGRGDSNMWAIRGLNFSFSLIYTLKLHADRFVSSLWPARSFFPCMSPHYALSVILPIERGRPYRMGCLLENVNGLFQHRSPTPKLHTYMIHQAQRRI